MEALSDEGERQAVFRVLDSFRQYRKQSHYATTHRRRQNFYALPQRHQDILNNSDVSVLDILSKIDDAIDENADIADKILEQALETYGLSEDSTVWHGTAKAIDLDKAHSTIRQFYRDWSKEGFEAEVKLTRELILEDLTANGCPGRQNKRVLLPGAGLGRLLIEICKAGYLTEGNEISYHQLFASNFILNATSHPDQYRLYPFLSNFNNLESREAQLKYVTIPDILPASTVAEVFSSASGGMSMSAGDFITSYDGPDDVETFDAVITVYFIDTAPNVFRYIETIHSCLKPGGLWVNIGPLLWHSEDRPDEKREGQDRRDDDSSPGSAAKEDDWGISEPGSVELSEDEIIHAVRSLGFEVLKQEMLDPRHGSYIANPASMMFSRYRCSHWVARKN